MINLILKFRSRFVSSINVRMSQITTKYNYPLRRVTVILKLLLISSKKITTLHNIIANLLYFYGGFSGRLVK